MAKMKPGDNSLSGALWNLRRAGRRLHRLLGGAVWIAGTCGAILVSVAVWRQPHGAVRPSLQEPKEVDSLPSELARRDMRALEAFDSLLVQHDDAPWVVQDLIDLAEEGGVLLTRASYSSEVEEVGRYRRFAISLPLKGKAKSVHLFIANALKKRPSLALQSAAFKRERSDMDAVEAQVQFVLYTAMPGADPAGHRRTGAGAVR